MRVLSRGWPRANAWRQRARVCGRAQAKLVSKPRRLQHLAARHGANPTPCSWMFGGRCPSALICDAPNLHNRGRSACSIDLQIRTSTSMLFHKPIAFKPHPYKAQSSQFPVQRLRMIRSSPRCTGASWLQWIRLQEASPMSVSSAWISSRFMWHPFWHL